MKHIYDGIYTFEILYDKPVFFLKGKGFFKNVTLSARCRWRNSQPVFASDATEAEALFMKSRHWLLSTVEPWSWNDTDKFIHTYTVTKKFIDAIPASHSLDFLKERMDSDMFLAYCRQELIDPKEVITS